MTSPSSTVPPPGAAGPTVQPAPGTLASSAFYAAAPNPFADHPSSLGAAAPAAVPAPPPFVLGSLDSTGSECADSDIAKAAVAGDFAEVQRLASSASVNDLGGALSSAIDEYPRHPVNPDVLATIRWLVVEGQIPVGSLAFVLCRSVNNTEVLALFLALPQQTLQAIASSPLRPFDVVLRLPFGGFSNSRVEARREMLLANPTARAALLQSTGFWPTALMEYFRNECEGPATYNGIRQLASYPDVCNTLVLPELGALGRAKATAILKAILSHPSGWDNVVGGLYDQAGTCSEGWFASILGLLRGRIEQSDISWGEWLWMKICYKWALFWAYRVGAHLEVSPAFEQDPYLPWIACIWNLFSRSPPSDLAP